MHVVQNVCADSGMPASPYCPNVIPRGVVALQAGNPLAAFLGTEYQKTLEDYLGLSTDNGGSVCTMHSAGSSSGQGGSPLPDRQADDAARLIAEAQRLLETLDPSGAQYGAVVTAASTLQQLVNSGASQSEITAAMTNLTYAMIGIH